MGVDQLSDFWLRMKNNSKLKKLGFVKLRLFEAADVIGVDCLYEKVMKLLWVSIRSLWITQMKW